jgi:hypothetical protein
MNVSSHNTQNNGGFPPLILKNNTKTDKKKEYFIASTINNNINIRQILQTKNTKNILDNIKKEKEDLDIVVNL